jgi:pyrimidine-nucleoside phosphorylase
MNAVDAIVRKRNGEVLPAGLIRELVEGFVDGRVADYQMSAFLMAALLRGLDAGETAALTEAMLHSGTVLDLSGIAGAKIDKHSTGGVGDKVSLVVAPLAAACGVIVPMISGRGLGHTGGTLDKLESIPGFRTDLDIEAMLRQLGEIGVAMIGQTDDIAPADRGLYALRDVTGTVESIPLIAASIMSKKLAAGLDGLVLDVKTGSGAFMPDKADARRLAETLVGVGEAYGCPTVALLTSMDAPLGRTAGNWPEVAESIRCLRGEGPRDLELLSVELTAEMLLLAGRAGDIEAARERARRALADGSALERFRSLVRAQGGDPAVVDDPDARPGSASVHEVVSDSEGVVQALDARLVGEACVAMGAGRGRKEDGVDPVAGVTLNKTVGDSVGRGDVLALLHGSDADRVRGVAGGVASAFRLGPGAPAAAPLLRGRYASGAWTAVAD